MQRTLIMNENFIPTNLNYNGLQIVNLLEKNISKPYRACTSIEIIEISRNFLKLNLPITSILYFTLVPNKISYIHKDIDLDRPYVNTYFALNLPLDNCAKTYMKWYLEKDGFEDNLTFGGVTAGAKTPMLRPEDSILTDIAEFTIPYVTKINGWHSIENQESTVSRLISIRFSKSITPDDVLSAISVRNSNAT